jgi:hypothetical protein
MHRRASSTRPLGGIYSGSGTTTNDVTIENKNGTKVMAVPTGTTPGTSPRAETPARLSGP